MKHCKYLHAKKLGKAHLILRAPYYYQCQQFSFDKSLGWGDVCKAFFSSFKMGIFLCRWHPVDHVSLSTSLKKNFLKNTSTCSIYNYIKFSSAIKTLFASILMSLRAYSNDSFICMDFSLVSWTALHKE